MDRHNHKRLYQPSITTYFQSALPNSLPGSTDCPHHDTHVDQQTQSSLLSLGMRIRKAVPEGYKTHKTLPSVPPPSSRQLIVPIANTRPRELRPLCGLFKVGGLEPQNFDDEALDFAFDSSQESNFSIQTEQDVDLDRSLFGGPVGSVTPKQKRRLDYNSDSDADDEQDYHPPQKFLASPGMAFPGRVFAKPRRRGILQPNSLASSVDNSVEFDFEEASFLKGDWEGSIDGEVEMGGL